MMPPLNMRHSCVEWDWDVIDPGSPEMDSCTCGDEDDA